MSLKKPIKVNMLSAIAFIAPVSLFLSYLFWVGFYSVIGFEFLGLLGTPDSFLSLSVVIVPIVFLYSNIATLIEYPIRRKEISKIYLAFFESWGYIVFLFLLFIIMFLLSFYMKNDKSEIYFRILALIFVIMLNLNVVFRIVAKKNSESYNFRSDILLLALYASVFVFSSGTFFASYRKNYATEVSILRSDSRIFGAKLLASTDAWSFSNFGKKNILYQERRF